MLGVLSYIVTKNNNKDDESKYLENDFADCNLLPHSHRYYARSYQL